MKRSPHVQDEQLTQCLGQPWAKLGSYPITALSLSFAFQTGFANTQWLPQGARALSLGIAAVMSFPYWGGCANDSAQPERF